MVISGLTVGGAGKMHRHLRLAELGKQNMRPFRCRVMTTEEGSWQFCVGGCSLFVERRLAKRNAKIQVIFRFASASSSQYVGVKRRSAASLHSRQSASRAPVPDEP